jgi:quercetin dioxygenase-like cupin family protein
LLARRKIMSTRPDPAEQAVHAAIATELTPHDLPPDRASELLRPVLQRVQQSMAAHAEYVTLRREDGEWRDAGHGVSIRRLRADDCVEIDLVRLTEGTPLPECGSATAQEWLLMEGHLELPRNGLKTGRLPPMSYAVLGSVSMPPMQPRAASACLLYCRTLRHPAWLPAAEAAWWQEAARAGQWRLPEPQAGKTSCQGVAMRPLCVSGDVASMLVRMDPGAKGADHGHALDEDCLVLQGDMYLGDILLRAGDYQLAPAGGSHFDIASDEGALFYFHGLLDPAVFGAAA